MLTMTAVPIEMIEAMLREHLADPSARLTGLETEPIPDAGYSGSLLFRVRLSWTSQRTGGGPSSSATWVLKRWLPGGHSERLLGIHQPLEALAWQHGLLRPEALPSGVMTPIVSAWPDADGRAAWIAMEDVSPALDRYSRDAPLHPAEALARVRLILDRLARLHTWWERPEQQATLRRASWLVPMERYLWCDAARCATALGRPVRAGIAPGSEVTDEYRTNLNALLAWLPSHDRPLFERLFCDREPLVAALRGLPRTLLHGDIGDPNLGLRPGPASATLDDTADLILIDWEWIGFGPPVLDVARLCGSFPIVHDPSQPLPRAGYLDDLLVCYFERYRAYGGVLSDAGAWHRATALALFSLSMSQLDFMGSMIRHDVTHVVDVLAHQWDAISATARTLVFD